MLHFEALLDSGETPKQLAFALLRQHPIMSALILKRLSRRVAIVFVSLALALCLMPDALKGDEAGSADAGEPAEVAVVVPTHEDELAAMVAEELPDPGLLARLKSGEADGIDGFILACGLGLALALVWIIWSYVRGLRGSPRELYLMFFTKVTEYSAYGAANMAFALYLSNDVDLSDMEAGNYIGAWSISMTLMTVLVGAICDAIGVKKTLLIGSYFLLLSRVVMPLTDSLWLVTLLGFVPLAVGTAITGPVLSVGVKIYSKRENVAMGFALFYTLMNVGWAIGGWVFDAVRDRFGDGKMHDLPLVGGQISTYQIIFAVGFFLTIPGLIAIMLMREGVEVTDEGVHIPEKVEEVKKPFSFEAVWKVIKSAAGDTAQKISTVLREKPFWIFILLIGILAFVRLTFYHFHYTFPTYGIRVFGEGAKVGNIWGVLNPVLIVFLVPLFGLVTKRVPSYWMLLVGSAVSVGSVFLALLPNAVCAPLVDTVVGELIFDRWLEVPVGERTPFYLTLILFFIIFTIGEAIWSPRLTQFMAEIAPKGKEGSYIALSYLPYFGAKFIAGPMSGWLLATYVPKDASSYPSHLMVWVWIGLMASLTPAGLLICRRLYKQAEQINAGEGGQAGEVKQGS